MATPNALAGVTALRSHSGGPALGAPAVNAPPLTHAGPTHEVELPSTHSAPTGATGSALGHRLSECGHDVTYGVRDPSDPRYQRLDTKRLPVKEAVAAADVVVIAIPWRAVEGLAGQLGDLGERVVIDATNPLAGGPQIAGFTSGAENIAAWTGSRHVVKAFNTTGAANVRNPVYPDGQPVMFIAADDLEAKETSMELANQIGFDAQDAGPLAAARDLEHLAALWIRLAYGLGHGPDIAYRLLRR